jgi:hypothetical protein
MSDSTASADGGAMPDTDRPTSLIDVVDEINAIRNLNEVAWIAAGSLSAKEEANPMQALLDLITERLSGVSDALNAIRLKPEARQ